MGQSKHQNKQAATSNQISKFRISVKIK